MSVTLTDRLLRLNSETRRDHPALAACSRVPAVILMTDPQRGAPLQAAQMLPPGAAVLIRHYDDPGREELALTLAALARRQRLRVMLALRDPVQDLPLADRIEADGIHLPEAVLKAGGLARLWQWRRGKPGRIITAAAHSPAALRRAEQAGVDAVLLSPVFATLSHPGAPFLGGLRVRRWVQQTRLPVLALGGISAQTIAGLSRSGIWGAAAIGGLTPRAIGG